MHPDAIALFRELADRSAAEREEYYASHRITEALRAEVESLLRFDRDTVESLHGHVAAAAEDVLLETNVDLLTLRREKRAADISGAWFGPYRLCRMLGEGGMGAVWLAEQAQPIRRTVAIKVVKPGADSNHVLSRFGSERQALAILNHPHVAKVFDTGTTPDGRPYFVMEHVPGQPITTFADQRRLTITERLELFLQVCDAVQHAHQKGLLHRDLKPANILVTDIDGRAVAKVIDFGIAKAMGLRLTGETLATELGVFVGTPEYMSPEQAGLVGASVDTRTDIFSLGIVLYELLAGLAPYDALKQGRSSVLEMLRLIREQEPPRLTKRLIGQSHAAANEIAERRRTEPQALARRLRGDLEWITARAIEKEPARRYASASELAADLRRYLDHEPVTAGPPDLLYRLGKLTRKHRATAIAAAVVIGIAIAAGVVSTIFWIRSERAQRETRRQLVSLHVAEGMRLVDDNDRLRALPWLTGALRIEPDGESAEDAHRRRIAMVLDRTPALANVWAFDAGVLDSDVSPDRTWIALATADGAPRIVDIGNGAVSVSRERHSGRINAVAISRDGRWLATAGSDKSARVWNRVLDAAGPALRHEDEVLAVALSPDGAHVATMARDEAVRVWDVENGTLRFTLAHDSMARAIAFSPDGELIATATGNTVKLWYAATGRPSGGDLQHSRRVDEVVFSNDGARLAVAANNAVRLWQVADRQPIGNEILHINPAYEMTFSADDRWLAWGSAGNILGIIDVQTGTLATPLLRRPDQVLSVSFSPDGRFLASLELGGQIQIWRTLTWQPEQLAIGGSPRARAVLFDRSGRRVVSVGESTALMWDLAAASSIHPSMPHPGGARNVSVTADGRTLLTTAGGFPGARDNYVRVWAAATSEPVTPPMREGGMINGQLDPTGERLATAGASGRVQLWDSSTGEPIGQPFVQGSFIVDLSFSPDGRYVASGGGDGYYEHRSDRLGAIHVWDIATGEARWKRQVPATVSALAFTPDGARLVTGTVAGDVMFWDATTGKRLPGEVHLDTMIPVITVSPDSRWSAIVTERGVHLWDHARAEGKLLASEASSASFDSSSTRLAIGTFDGEVSVWDVATGRPLNWMMKPGGMIYSARFDRHGRYIVTASLDGSTRVWDAAGRAVSPRLRHEGSVWSARFMPDDRTIASGGGSARIWDFRLETGAVEDLVRFAEVASGYRLSSSMTAAPLAPHERRQAFEQLTKSHASWFSVAAQSEAQWERSAAEWALATGRVRDAVPHVDRVVALEPSRAMAWAERGRVRAELGLWRDAVSDFEKAIELRPDAAEYYRDLALARFGGGDSPGFQRACREMRTRFGTTRNPDRAQWVARTCVLVPADGQDVTDLVRTAEYWSAIDRTGVHQLGTLGAALVRAGQRDSAAAMLRRALEAAGTMGDTWASLFLTMLEANARSHRCDAASKLRAAFDERSRAPRAAVTWQQRVEVDALVGEICARF